MSKKNPHQESIHLYSAHNARIFGQNIGIAVLDTGVYPHPDLCLGEGRIAAFSDFVSGRPYPYDDANHGTHVCGILASGKKDPKGRYLGIAPASRLIVGKILDRKGNGKIPSALAAFQWILDHKNQYQIRIVNISVGMPVDSPTDEFSPFMTAVNQLWDAGLIVVAAAGNNGPKGKTITAPGISRKIITVGSCEEPDFPLAQSGFNSYSGSHENHSSNSHSRSHENHSSNSYSGLPENHRANSHSRSHENRGLNPYSGRGPTINCIKKPDITAPGNEIYSCHNVRREYIYKSGTSMSTPMVSGALALLLSVEPHLSNKEVKLRLLESARDLHLPWQQQGAGMLDIKKLLRL